MDLIQEKNDLNLIEIQKKLLQERKIRFLRKEKTPSPWGVQSVNLQVRNLGDEEIKEILKNRDDVELIKIEDGRNGKRRIFHKTKYFYSYFFKTFCPICNQKYEIISNLFYAVYQLSMYVGSFYTSDLFCEKCWPKIRERYGYKVLDEALFEYRKKMANEIRKKMGVKTLDEIGTSTSEKKLKEILKTIYKNKRIYHKDRHTLPNYMELDFYLPQLKIAIEYQGEQHTRFIKGWHKTKEGFEKVKEKDRRKRELCKKKGIKLIEIHYKEPLSVKHIKEKLKKEGIKKK